MRWALCVLILSGAACKTKSPATTTASSDPEVVAASAPPWVCISDERGTSCERTQAACDEFVALLQHYGALDASVACTVGSATAYCFAYTTYGGQVEEACTATLEDCNEVAAEFGAPDQDLPSDIVEGSIGACVATATDTPLPPPTPQPAGWFCYFYEEVGGGCEKSASNCQYHLEPEDPPCTAAAVAYCFSYATTDGTLYRSCSETDEECSYDADDMSSGMTMLPMDSKIDRSTVSACVETP